MHCRCQEYHFLDMESFVGNGEYHPHAVIATDDQYRILTARRNRTQNVIQLHTRFLFLTKWEEPNYLK